MFKDLIDRKLVTAKTYENGLSIFKYSKQVFFKALWNEDARLLDARGLVLDSEGVVVQMPFTKVFNYKENNTFVPLDMEVEYIRKVNGFLGVATWYKGEVLFSTTGTLDSEFVEMAKETISAQGDIVNLCASMPNYSFMFEVCHEKDPHIVKEDLGAYLIGARIKELGSSLHEEACLDKLAAAFGFKRPEFGIACFSEVLKANLVATHEGFMVRDAETKAVLCKLKSPHYLITKFLGRNKSKVHMIWSDKHSEVLYNSVDEEFYPLLDYLKVEFTLETWAVKSEQEKILVIRDFLTNH